MEPSTSTLSIRLNHPKLNSHTYTFPVTTSPYVIFQTLPRNTPLQLFSNYYYSYQQQPIFAPQDLTEIIRDHDKRQCIQLDVVFEAYNLATAQYHFREVYQLLKDPLAFSRIVKPVPETNHVIESPRLEREFLDESWSQKEWDVSSVAQANYKSSYWDPPSHQRQLIMFIEWSGFNPPPPQAQMMGDFFYLHLRTLENIELHITACGSGFYLNQSKINAYSPTIQQGRSIHTSLVDLFSSVSDKFTQALNKNVEICESSLYAVSLRSMKLNQPHQSKKWLDHAQGEHQWNSRKEASIRQIEKPYQVQMNWNQCFIQIQREAEQLRSQNQEEAALELQRVGFRKLYSEFEAAVVQGAKRLVEGRMHAINHMEQAYKHIFIHNKIFFSITQDHATERHIQRAQDCQIPSSAAANTQIANLSTLARMHLPTLRLLHTIMVRYRGIKIIAQTVIPGLLSTELNSITLHGSVDEGKTIQTNPEFHQLMSPLYKQLHLDPEVQAITEGQKVVSIAISPDIKGIRSTDGERYLCDLQKLSPRDLNYPGNENQTCVIREQLLDAYGADHPDFKEGVPLNNNIETQVKFKQGNQHAEQEKVLKNIAYYLLDVAIPKVIHCLKSKNAGDYLTDSKGISKVFHKFGVNLRYLGLIQKHQYLTDHLQARICLRRVILSRSIKHLLRQVFKSTSQAQLGHVLCHILNCLFAPKMMLGQLNKTEIREPIHEVVESKKRRKKKGKEEQKQAKNNGQQEGKSIKVPPSPYSHIRAQDVWTQVCEIASARFDHQFPEDIFEFHQEGLFRLHFQKYATLRDVCINSGLVLEKREYRLGQNEEEVPFEPKDILYFSPMTKIMSIPPSKTLQHLLTQTDLFFQNNNYYDALKGYEEAAQYIRTKHEGENHLSHCLAQAAHIYYMQGRNREAISLATQNLCFSRQEYGQDSLEVIKSYSRLGLYCMSETSWRLSLWLLSKGLHLMLTCFGQNYPQVLINFANIAKVLSNMGGQSAKAAQCYLKAIEIFTKVYGGKNHINISICYSSLATLHYEMGEFKRAVEYQSDSVNILLKVLSTEDTRCQDAQKILRGYKDTLNKSRSRR